MKPTALILAGAIALTLGLARGSLAAEVNCACLTRIVCEQRPNCRDPGLGNCLTCKTVEPCPNWDISLDFKTKKITVAAYSGCFIGTFRATPAGAGTIIDAKNLAHHQGCDAKRAPATKGSFKLYLNNRSYRYVLLEGGEGVDYGQCRPSPK